MNANTSGNLFSVLSGGAGLSPEVSRTLQMDDHAVSKMGGSMTRETGVGSRLRMTQHMVNKNNERSENFKKVREAALSHAIDINARHVMRDHRDR